MTPQSTFTIIAVVKQDQLTALRALLRSLNDRPGHADPANTLVPFGQFSQLHMARFTVLEANTNEDIAAHGVEPRPWAPALAFIGDIDGRTDVFFPELCLRAGPGLRQIFAHCEGFDAESSDLLSWLTERNQFPEANYINWRGRTVQQIHEERLLARFLRDQINQWEPLGEPLEPREIHQRLRNRVRQEVAELRLRLSEPQPTPVGWWLGNLLHLLVLPLLLLVLAPILVLLAPLYFLRLRQLECRDPENRLRPSGTHLQHLVSGEDLEVTNQFNAFGQVKPGWFRRHTIRVLLWLLDYAVRHIYHRGYLTRLQTIHFARWILLDGGHRIFFASNYDGSADSYMDDFINKVAWGLNLVFSNGVGYPRTRWLIKDGAQSEQKYKYTLRRNQLPSESWYKAYPGLTAYDLARNHRIRTGLESDSLSTLELDRWLQSL